MFCWPLELIQLENSLFNIIDFKNPLILGVLLVVLIVVIVTMVSIII